MSPLTWSSLISSNELRVISASIPFVVVTQRKAHLSVEIIDTFLKSDSNSGTSPSGQTSSFPLSKGSCVSTLCLKYLQREQLPHRFIHLGFLPTKKSWREGHAQEVHRLALSVGLTFTSTEQHTLKSQSPRPPWAQGTLR